MKAWVHIRLHKEHVENKQHLTSGKYLINAIIVAQWQIALQEALLCILIFHAIRSDTVPS